MVAAQDLGGKDGLRSKLTPKRTRIEVLKEVQVTSVCHEPE